MKKKKYLRIKTSGDIDFDKQIYLYNLNDAGKPGFEVINPIKIGDENYLVNRGWISFEKKDLPEINLVDQNQIVGTLMLQTKASTFKPENDIEKNYWFTLNREDIFKFTGRNFSEYVIYLNGEYNIKGLYVGVPVVIGKNGVEKVLEIDLNEKEKNNFRISVQAVEELFESAKKIDPDLSN